MLFPVNQRGGSLFLKIITDHLTASDERTKESLLKSIKAYNNTTIDAKYIQIVYNQLLTTAETLIVLNDNILPSHMIKFISISLLLLAVPSSMNNSRTSRNNSNIRFCNQQFGLVEII